MSENAPRRELDEAQKNLVLALMGRRGAPAGFDAARVALAGNGLRRKRARAVAKTWPMLARALGEGFWEHFAIYAAQTPLPDDGPIADGGRFVEHLRCRGAFPEAAASEALRRKIRGFRWAAAMWLPQSRRWALRVELPRLRAWRMTLRLPGALRRRQTPPAQCESSR